MHAFGSFGFVFVLFIGFCLFARSGCMEKRKEEMEETSKQAKRHGFGMSDSGRKCFL